MRKSEKYKSYKDPLTFKYATIGNRKFECPFRLKGRPNKVAGGWWLKVMCGIHNHEATKTLVGHAYVGQLTIDEKSMVENMAKNVDAPKTCYFR